MFPLSITGELEFAEVTPTRGLFRELRRALVEARATVMVVDDSALEFRRRSHSRRWACRNCALRRLLGRGDPRQRAARTSFLPDAPPNDRSSGKRAQC